MVEEDVSGIENLMTIVLLAVRLEKTCFGFKNKADDGRDEEDCGDLSGLYTGVLLCAPSTLSRSHSLRLPSYRSLAKSSKQSFRLG